MNESKKYTLEITHIDNYIDVRSSGKFTLEENYHAWVEILNACESFNCFNILGVSNLEPFDVSHAYQHKDIFKDTGVTWKHKIAWVEENPNNQSMIKLIETVLINRGLLNGRVFPSEQEAKDWLLKNE